MTRLRPSLALVVAVLALALAMSGTAYSVTKVSGNSLIKKKSLSGNRLKADSVKGGQVDEASLGTVPHATSAATAGRATIADTVPAPPLTPFAFGPGWASNTGVTGRDPGYRKDASGFVHLQGGVGRTTGSSSVIAILPPGFRASDFTYFPVYSISAPDSSIVLDSAGRIQLFSGNAAYVSLEGITFYPDR